MIHPGAESGAAYDGGRKYLAGAQSRWKWFCRPSTVGPPDAKTLLNKLNIRLSADRLVGELSIAAQQNGGNSQKRYHWNADIVIMDEPASR